MIKTFQRLTPSGGGTASKESPTTKKKGNTTKSIKSVSSDWNRRVETY